MDNNGDPFLGLIMLCLSALPFIGICLGLFVVVFWLWALVDCLANEPSGSDKIVWVLVLIFGGPLGALLYWLIRRRNRLRT